MGLSKYWDNLLVISHLSYQQTTKNSFRIVPCGYTYENASDNQTNAYDYI